MNALEIVRKLTRFNRQRRIPVSSDVRPDLLTFVVALLLSQGIHASTPAKWHPIADMTAVAEAFVQDRLDHSSGRSSVTASQLDERLKLSKCSVPIEAFFRAGTTVGPKTMVGVRCSGAKPWKIYVPVEVTVRRQLWVARQALARGHLLTEDDLYADTRDVSRMTSSYVSDKDSLLGQRLKTSILAGRALTLQMLEADNIVRRGQTVTLSVSTGGVNIRMTGRAMSDGAMNQRIRVENLNSGRVVEGVVRSRELVEVLVPGGLSAHLEDR